MKTFKSLLIIAPAVCILWSCSKHESNPNLSSGLGSIQTGNYTGTLEVRGTGGLAGQVYDNTINNCQVQVTYIDDSTIQFQPLGVERSIPFTASLSPFNNVIILNIPYQSSGNYGITGQSVFNVGNASCSGILDPNAKTLEASIMATVGGVPGCPVVFETFQGTKQ